MLEDSFSTDSTVRISVDPQGTPENTKGRRTLCSRFQIFKTVLIIGRVSLQVWGHFDLFHHSWYLSKILRKAVLSAWQSREICSEPAQSLTEFSPFTGPWVSSQALDRFSIRGGRITKTNTKSKQPLNTFFYKICFAYGVSSQQWNRG